IQLESDPVLMSAVLRAPVHRPILSPAPAVCPPSRCHIRSSGVAVSISRLGELHVNTPPTHKGPAGPSRPGGPAIRSLELACGTPRRAGPAAAGRPAGPGGVPDAAPGLVGTH